MEFNFSINSLFKEKLTKVKNNLLPENYSSDRRGDGDVVTKVSSVLDKMGIVSAKAQQLPVAITSASKLRNSDHVVYVMTDPEGNKGHGTVVGILKVGIKKLFIYDFTGIQWEMDPLCVLDFYVHESKQRTGCGRLLFDYMLKDQRISPNHLALDQPSESFLSFMCKHYGLDSIIPQINSFVVYDSFFDGRSDKVRGSSSHSAGSKNKSSVQSVKALSRSHEPTTPSYGRHSAKKAGSVMAEYMQDPSLMSLNGNRQNSLPTNQSPIKTNVNKMQAAGDINGLDSQAQIRPTSLPEKLNGPCSTAESSHPTGDQIDAPDSFDENPALNGAGISTPEEVPGKLDLKFHHTHLCEYSDDWPMNQSGGPLAQYGHYWSSISELLSEDQASETDGMAYQNGNSSKHRVRKVSNIPIGEGSLDEDDDEASGTVLPPKPNDQNDHPFRLGTNGVRDVRIKKTMFHNLSPYRN